MRSFPPMPVVLALLSLATPALAARSLDEPASFAKTLKAAPKADVDKALTDLALQERCVDGLKASDLRGIECRGAVVARLARNKPLEAQADVDARIALFGDLAKAAGSVSTWAPLTPPPGLGRARFDAHRALSAALMSVYDDLARVRSRNAAVDAWWQSFSKAAGPDPKGIACGVAGRTVELATGANTTQEERGAAQSVLTSRACGLDESRLQGAPKLGAALKDSADAASVAKSTSSEAAILAYAQSRTIDLERCKKHLEVNGKPKDDAKRAALEQCACGAVARWKLPKPSAATSTKIPVNDAVLVALDVSPNGAVAKCGPVEVR